MRKLIRTNESESGAERGMTRNSLYISHRLSQVREARKHAEWGESFLALAEIGEERNDAVIQWWGDQGEIERWEMESKDRARLRGT